ncbi:MAG: hypothetical protein FAF04_08255, partial [Epsilonproteobacteria bacterium]|nr:hypothetical protein [Campylobacterota bacterium]
MDGCFNSNNDIDKHNKELRTRLGNIGKEISKIGQSNELSGAEKAEKIKSLLKEQRELAKGLETPVSSDEKDTTDKNAGAKTPADKNSTPAKMSMREMYQQIEDSKVDSQLGQAAGIKENVNKGVSYAQNAMYSEESKQQSTKAKIDTQGGVEKAVASDVAEATIKAKQQQAGTIGSITEFLQSKAGGSHSSQEAEKMAKAIMEGGKGAAEFMKQAVSGAGALAFAQSAAKTGSDLATVEEHGGAEEFIKAQKRTAVEKAVHSNLASKFAENQDAKDKQISEERTQFKAAGKEKEYLEDGKKYGFLDKDGNATKDAEAWVRGRATMTAASMTKHEQGFIGDSRINTVTNPLTGESITNVDGTRKISEGSEVKANLYNAETMNEQKDLERAEHALDWKKTVAKVMSQGGTKASELNHYLNENGFNTGMDDETAATVGNAGTYAVTTVIGAAMLNQAPKALGGKRSIWNMVDDLVSGAENPETAQKTGGDS